jgi:outer membrane protein OmpA-like peptidoglycan-associated protein
MGVIKKVILVSMILSFGVSSCSSLSTKMKSVGIGCLAGLAAGAIYDAAKDKANKEKRKQLQNQIGSIFKKQKSQPEYKGKIVGLGVGCLAGLGAGYYLDTMAEDMDQQLKEAGMSVRKIQGPDGETEELLINAGENALEFLPDSTKLTPTSAPKVSKIAEALQGYPETKIRIEGNVSAVKKDDFNTRLSLQRAEAIRDQIVSYGVSSSRIYKVVGRANENPLPGIPPTDPRNRRVEIFIRADEK